MIILKFGIGTKWVYITDSKDEYKKKCKSVYGSTPDIGDKVNGQSFGCLVWVCSFDCIPVVVHELIHTVDDWMSHIGAVQCTETRAYVVEWLLEQLLKKLKKKKAEAK